MTDLPNGRLGQALALGLTLIVVGAMWLGVVAPLAGWYDERAETLSQRRVLLRRVTVLADTIPELQRQAAETDAGPATGALLTSGSDAVAGATLQQRVQDMASGLGISLSSVETLPPQQEGRYRRIRLRVATSSTLPVLMQLLNAVGRARPQMLIDNLDLEAASVLLHPRGVQLDANVTIIGFREATASDNMRASGQ